MSSTNIGRISTGSHIDVLQASIRRLQADVAKFDPNGKQVWNHKIGRAGTVRYY